MEDRMIRKLIGALIAMLMLVASVGLSAVGTVVVTQADVSSQNLKFRRYTIAWTSDAAGAVSGNAFEVRAGRLASVRFVPGSGGVQPTDLYDVTLIDTNSIDHLSGVGANLSNATSSLQQWDPQIFQDGSRTFDLVVANAGNAKSGTVVLLVQVTF
jgi:hypothetical protein